MGLFNTLPEAKVLIERWRRHYNIIRPHAFLEYQPSAPWIDIRADIVKSAWTDPSDQTSIESSAMLTEQVVAPLGSR
ncbi:integrase core domain-containing protein [Ahrensia marina]|uniref:integrase core domain-containing protein n=1 Tax=Ahrensia marina TaxID=1514904 RepID=UPI0035CF0696